MITSVCLRCQSPLNQTIKWAQLWQFKSIKAICVCTKCHEAFTPTKLTNFCRYCLHPLEAGESCFDCQYWLTIYDASYLKHDAIYLYDEAFKAWITDYKYRNDVRQAWVMVESLIKYYQQYKQYDWTILPSSDKNMNKRGFNPSEYLLKCANIPYTRLFEYQGDNNSQAQKTKEERLRLSQVFALRETNLQGRKILIFDDVYTTGATLMKAKESLLNHQCEECYSLTLARDVMK